MRGEGESTFSPGRAAADCRSDKVLAKQAIAAHQIVAYVLLTLIALARGRRALPPLCPP